jgi:hypothetical protein
MKPVESLLVDTAATHPWQTISRGSSSCHDDAPAAALTSYAPQK